MMAWDKVRRRNLLVISNIFVANIWIFLNHLQHEPFCCWLRLCSSEEKFAVAFPLIRKYLNNSEGMYGTASWKLQYQNKFIENSIEIEAKSCLSINLPILYRCSTVPFPSSSVYYCCFSIAFVMLKAKASINLLIMEAFAFAFSLF